MNDEIKKLFSRCYGKNKKLEICDDLDKFIQCIVKNQNILNETKYDIYKPLPPQYDSNIKIMKDIISRHKIIRDNVCYTSTQIDFE